MEDTNRILAAEREKIPLSRFWKKSCKKSVLLWHSYRAKMKINWSYCAESLQCTVWRQKKRPKVNECSSVANYRTAMIFFLQNSQHSYVFFDGNFFCQEFVCLPFFCHFSLLEGPKRAPKHPQVNKIPILGMKQCSSTSQTL